MTTKTTYYIITNDKTGEAMGRTSIGSPMGWVEPQFAATYVDYDTAQAASVAVFGARETLIGDVRLNVI